MAFDIKKLLKEVAANLGVADSIEGGRGIISPANIMDVYKAPVDFDTLGQGTINLGEETFDRSIIPQVMQSVQQSIPPIPDFVQPGIGSAVGQGLGTAMNYPEQLYKMLGDKARESLRAPAFQDVLQTATGKPTTELFGESPQKQTPKDYQINPKYGENFDKRIGKELGEESDIGGAKKTALIRRLIKAGVPLAAAGLGTAVPGALAGASGFAQGFSGATSRQKQLAEQAAIKQKETEGALAKTIRSEDAAQKLKALEYKLQRLQAPEITNEEIIENYEDIKKAGGPLWKKWKKLIKERFKG